MTQLLDWVTWHFEEGKRIAQEVMQDEKPENHTKYWDAVCKGS